jgi:hypothetical protein
MQQTNNTIIVTKMQTVGLTTTTIAITAGSLCTLSGSSGIGARPRRRRSLLVTLQQHEVGWKANLQKMILVEPADILLLEVFANLGNFRIVEVISTSRVPPKAATFLFAIGAFLALACKEWAEINIWWENGALSNRWIAQVPYRSGYSPHC